MKKFIFVLCGACAIISVSAQTTQFRKDNLLLPDKLMVSEVVPFDSLYINKINADKPDSFTKPVFTLDRKFNPFPIIASKALGGQVKVFDPDEFCYGSLKPMDTDAIEKGLGKRTVTMVQLDSIGNSTEVQLEEAMRVDQLLSMKFYEAWNFTDKPLSFSKQVLAYTPIRRYGNVEVENEFTFREVFVVQNSQETKEKQLQYMGHVEFEYFFNIDHLYSFDNYAIKVRNYLTSDVSSYDYVFGSKNAPYFNTICQRNFIEVLVRKALKGEVKVTGYANADVLDTTDVKAKIFRPVDISYMNVEGIMKDTTLINDVSSQVYSVIFMEDWYFDPESLQIQKKVKAIAPVRYFDENADKIIREVLFVFRLPENNLSSSK